MKEKERERVCLCVKSTLLKFSNAKLYSGQFSCRCIDLHNFILLCLHIDFCQIKIRLLLTQHCCLAIELSSFSLTLSLQLGHLDVDKLDCCKKARPVTCCCCCCFAVVIAVVVAVVVVAVVVRAKRLTSIDDIKMFSFHFT